MSRIEYAVLKYYNNIISEECLYIGMLYNNLTTGKRGFRYISNFDRLQSFDDEADINFIKAYLEGIKQQVENNIFNYNTSFDMKEFSRFYVNEFRFSDIAVIDVDDNEDVDLVSNKQSEDKEEKQMAVSMAVVPLLKGKAAEGIMKDFKNSKLKSYSERERKQTNAAIAEILRQKKMEKDANSLYKEGNPDGVNMVILAAPVINFL